MKLLNSRKNALLLGLCALITAGLISLVFVTTKDTIAAQQIKKLHNELSEVLPNSVTTAMENCVRLPSLSADIRIGSIYRQFIDRKLVAVAVEATTNKGYSGDISLLIGLTGPELRTVHQVRVLQHRETPGLGDKIDLRISPWILSFSDQQLTDDNQSQWQVSKDGGQFDAFTGATITPRAVVNAVAETIRQITVQHTSLSELASNCQEYQ